MRQLYRIPHPKLSITVFGMNERFILKLEAGPMEQTYKIPEESVTGPEDVKLLLDGPFLTEILAHFNAMYRSLLDAQQRFSAQGGAA